MDENIRYGLPAETIAKIEEELPNLDLQTIIARMDAIFSKGWSFEYEGPDLVDVPVTPALSTTVSRTKPAKMQLRPHWQCRCTVEIMVPDDGVAYRRDHTMLLEATAGAFEVIRDLSLIYCLVKGFGLGSKGTCPLPAIDEYKPATEPAPPVVYEDYQLALGELQEIKHKLGIKKTTDLDKYVAAFSNGALTRSTQIGKANVRAFVEYLKDILNGRQPAPHR